MEILCITKVLAVPLFVIVSVMLLDGLVMTISAAFNPDISTPLAALSYDKYIRRATPPLSGEINE